MNESNRQPTPPPERRPRPAVVIPPVLPLLLDANLIAALLSMSRRSFDRAVSRGEFPRACIRQHSGQFVRWRRHVVTEWIESQAGEPVAQ